MTWERMRMWLVSSTTVSDDLPCELRPGEYLLGRAKSARIVFRDRTVSKEHATLFCQGASVEVEDHNSLNGTFINGRPIKRGSATLHDELQFGAVRCRLVASRLATPAADESLSTLQVRMGSQPTIDISGLTPAQKEILGLVLQGMDDRAIAKRTARSPGTVHSHMKAIHGYFQVHSRPELIAKLLAGQRPSR